MTEEQISKREFSLDIIIPQYSETSEVIKPLLDSIAIQSGIDMSKVGVIIVNDHNPEGKLPQEFLDSYDLNIRYLETPENRGPGQARQFGIDASDADYILFADADDRFYSCDVFYKFYDAIRQHSDKVVDIVFSKWVEELNQPENGVYMQIPHNSDSTWVFSKLYRREFLTSHNLRFHDGLRVHEDSHFCTITQMNAGITLSMDHFTYYWGYNNNSITRNKNSKYNYLVESADDLVKSIDYTMTELTKRKTKNREEYLVKGVLFLFFLLNAPYWNVNLENDPELRRRRQKYEYGILKILVKYQNEINAMNRQQFLQFYNAERAQCLINTGFETEVMTWDQFIGYLNQSYPRYSHTCADCKHKTEDGKCPFSENCNINLDTDYGEYSTPTSWEPIEEPVKEKEDSDKKSESEE